MAVYVIKRRGDTSGLVKIGFTNNVDRRLKDLSTATPEGFDVLYVFDGGRSLEAHLHELLSGSRVVGEWFQLTEYARSIIEATNDASDGDERRRSPIPTPDDEFSVNIVLETRFYLNELVKREWKGMGDTVEAARDRVMDACGADRSYGFRLWSKFHELNDVSGNVYREIRLHFALALHAEGNLTAHQERFLKRTVWRASAGDGMDSSEDRKG